jgi:hypothetical protein
MADIPGVGGEIRLRPRGAGRWFDAAFLTVWLTAWAVGEGIVLWILIKGGVALVTGQPPDPAREPLVTGPSVLVGLFLLVWLSLWTIGGIAALTALVKATWAEDYLVVRSGRLMARWSRGLFRFRRAFERGDIRRVLLNGRDHVLTLDIRRERVDLSTLGTADDRRAALATLEAELGLPAGRSREVRPTLPESWEVIVTPEGARAVVPNRRTRRLQTRVAAGITLFLGGLTVTTLVADPDAVVPACILFALTAATAMGVVRLTRGRAEWRLGSGRLTLRKRYGPAVHDVLEVGRLVLETTSDSDGDEWVELYALPLDDGAAAPDPVRDVWRGLPRNRRTVFKRMNDAITVRDFAAWLSRESGIALEDRATPEAKAAELARLRDRLASSGAFGRWAGRMLDRFGAAKGKS